MTASLAGTNPGSDPLHAVYDFAAWAAEQAPADSPLAVLPVVAHAERYRVLAAAGAVSDDPAASGHWSGRRARQVMKAAFDWWLEWEREDHPRHHTDLNFLAHAKICEGRPAEAAHCSTASARTPPRSRGRTPDATRTQNSPPRAPSRSVPPDARLHARLHRGRDHPAMSTGRTDTGATGTTGADRGISTYKGRSARCAPTGSAPPGCSCPSSPPVPR